MHLKLTQITQSSIIWIVVANKEQAQVYRYHQKTKITPKQGQTDHEEDKESEPHELTPLGNMRVDRSLSDNFQIGHDAHGALISVEYPEDSQHPLQNNNTHNVAQEVAIKLTNALEAKLFNHLIVVASPEFLDTLMETFDAKVLACVIAEVGQDLVYNKSHELLARLQKTFEKVHIA